MARAYPIPDGDKPKKEIPPTECAWYKAFFKKFPEKSGQEAFEFTQAMQTWLADYFVKHPDEPYIGGEPPKIEQMMSWRLPKDVTTVRHIFDAIACSHICFKDTQFGMVAVKVAYDIAEMIVKGNRRAVKAVKEGLDELERLLKRGKRFENVAPGRAGLSAGDDEDDS